MALPVWYFILANFGTEKDMGRMTTEAHVVVCFCNTRGTCFKAGVVTLT